MQQPDSTSVALQDLTALLNLATEHKGVGRVWQEQRSQSQDESWDGSQSQGQSPSPVGPDCTVVDAGCSQDSENTEALEEQVEGTPPSRRRDL